MRIKQAIRWEIQQICCPEMLATLSTSLSPDELCLRQSAGDSTSPEINIAAGVLGKLYI
jgi:hypothetical protein